MNPDALPAVAALAVAFAAGVKSTFGLWRDYRVIAPIFTRPVNRLLGRAFVIVSVLVTLAAGYYGFIATRRLLGYEALDWSPIISLLIAIPVLFIPVYLRRVWNRVGEKE